MHEVPTKEDIKHMVKNGNMVHFVKYFDGCLWYKLSWSPPIIRPVHFFEFPVPVSDIGNATFLATDKAMLFMRYIRKHIETLNEGQQYFLGGIPDDSTEI